MIYALTYFDTLIALINRQQKRNTTNERLQALAKFHTFSQLFRRRRLAVRDLPTLSPKLPLAALEFWTRFVIGLKAPANPNQALAHDHPYHPDNIAYGSVGAMLAPRQNSNEIPDSPPNPMDDYYVPVNGADDDAPAPESQTNNDTPPNRTKPSSYKIWLQQNLSQLENELIVEARDFVESESGENVGELLLDGEWHPIDKDQKKGYIGKLKHGANGKPYVHLTYNDFKSDKHPLPKSKIVDDAWARYKADNPLPKFSKYPTAKEALEQYKSLPEQGHSAYLDRKQVTPAQGIRFGTQGETPCLYVPMQSLDGDIKAVQLIAASKIFKIGGQLRDKHNPKGTSKNGLSFHIGLPPLEATKIVVTSGVATGLTTFQSGCADCVLCAFDDGNMLHVAAELDKKGLEFIVAADNDDNLAGISKARKILEKYPKARVTFPTDIKGTDFNDLQVEQSAAAVLEQFNKNQTDIAGLDAVFESGILSIGQSVGTVGQSVGTQKKSVGTQKKSVGTLEKSDKTDIKQEDTVGWHVWHAPTPLIEKNEGLVEVTNDMLPQNVGEWVNDIAKRMQIYPTFPSVALLSFVSAIIARRIAIYPKQFDKEWRVIPNIWGAIVGQPGVQKSPAISPIFEPIRKREQLLRVEYEKAVKDYNAALDKWKGNKEHEQKPTPPTRKRLFISDGTMEAIHAAHLHNPQGILLYRDELSGFIETMSKKGREGERQMYLEGWGGDGTFSMTRMSRDDVSVDGLCLTPFGGIQPSVLSKYISDAAKGVVDDGFIQRFQLLVSSVAKPDYVLTDVTPDYAAKERYVDTINRLLDLPSHGSPVVTSFEQEAQTVFNHWLESLERRIRSGGLSPIIASHISKYRSLLPSLALIFEVITNPAFCVQNIVRQEILPKVSLGNLNLAIKWVEFLEKHARNLFLDSPSEANPAALLAEKILQKFRLGKWHGGATERSLKRMFRAKADSQHFDEALELLEDFGWVQFDERIPPKGGKVSKVILVNPCLLENEDTTSVSNVPTEQKNVINSVENTDKTNSFDKNIPLNQNVPTASQNVPTDWGKNGDELINTGGNTPLPQNVPTVAQNVPTVSQNVPTDAIAPNKNNSAIKDTDNSKHLSPPDINTQSQPDNADLVYNDQDLNDLFGGRVYMLIKDFLVGGTQSELDALLKKGRIQIASNPNYIALGYLAERDIATVPYDDNIIAHNTQKPLDATDTQTVAGTTNIDMPDDDWKPAVPAEKFMLARLKEVGPCNFYMVGNKEYAPQYTQKCLDYWVEKGLVKVDNATPNNPLYSMA